MKTLRNVTSIETDVVSSKALALVSRQAALSQRPMRVAETPFGKTKYRIMLDPTPTHPITFDVWQSREWEGKEGPKPLPVASIYTFPNGERLLLNNGDGSVGTPEEYQDFDRDFAPVPPRKF